MPIGHHPLQKRLVSLCFCLAACVVVVNFAGCCCVPPARSCSSAGLMCGGSCQSGLDPRFNSGALSNCDNCGDCTECATGRLHGIAGLLSRASCNGACGEVYVGEWLSEPPCPDDCGYNCGGCGNCGSCRPVLNTLRLLWGRPYQTCCSSPGCTGCDEAPAEVMTGEMEYYPAPEMPDATPAPQIEEPTPAPDPQVRRTRLNPAQQRQSVRQANYKRVVRQ